MIIGIKIYYTFVSNSGWPELNLLPLFQAYLSLPIFWSCLNLSFTIQEHLLLAGPKLLNFFNAFF